MIKYGLIAVATALTLASCSKDKASMEVSMTDAPGDYLEVNVDVQSVEIHYADDEDSSSWTTLDTEAGIYNLIELQDSSTVIAPETELDAGKVSQIRLILGENNTVVLADSSVFDLTVPSGSSSGLKIQVNETLEEGEELEVLLDFDADESVNKTGNDKYILRPVIRQVK